MGQIVARSVYVISDLHLGGDYAATPAGRGFRINTHVRELAQFVNSLGAEATSDTRVELVINGDIVDFLAEKDNRAAPSFVPFTSDGAAACAKLQTLPIATPCTISWNADIA